MAKATGAQSTRTTRRKGKDSLPPTEHQVPRAEASPVESDIVSKEVAMTQERIREQEMTTRLEEIERGQEFVVAGETTIYDEVISSIAGVAAKEVQGVAALGKSSIRRTLAERVGGAEQRARGVGVEAGKKEAIVDLSLVVVYGFSIPKIIIEVRKRVAARLLDTVGLIAKEINVSIVGIEFPERMPGKLE